MELKDFYKKYPTKQDCLVFLEKLKWNEVPVCPYCESKRNSKTKDNRHYCNSCLSSYSVTVGTTFHKTRIDLQKWFFAIYLINNTRDITYRKLGIEIETTKDTAWRISHKLNEGILKNDILINKILNNE